ncbi:RloB family protein [Limibacter armeniacum]|uniref:RloB family protein n=1 Tax=Limibacter armeniacum TaxID=466084 RepID=UPI002FE568DB
MRRTRPDKVKTLRQRVLILCEGAQTEPNYFNGLKHDMKLRRRLSAVDIEVYQPKQYTPLGLIREAITKKKKALSKRNPYDAIWLVFDRDFHRHIEEVFDMCYKNDVQIAYSNICFELWFLLHFEQVTSPFNKCKNLISYLHDEHNLRYQKNGKNYEQFKELTQQAIANARLLESYHEYNTKTKGPKYEWNPYTNVYELVEYLLDL